MATANLSSSSLSILLCQNRTTERFSSFSFASSVRLPISTFSFFLTSSSSSSTSISISHSHSHKAFDCVVLRIPIKTKISNSSVLAVTEEAEEEKEQIARSAPVEVANDDEDNSSKLSKARTRPCELYVCNLPRNCGISELLEMFKPYGTVQSVEVSRNAETGISRGCGYVTMSLINEAKAAITTLDGSDVGGREVRVRFSVEMNPNRKNLNVLNSTPNRNIIFESPYKIYVGNLAWSVKPQELREHFSQFGTLVSTRLLSDRKAGKSRAYGFLSFSSVEEREAALSSDGVDFHGRTLLVRRAIQSSEL